MARSSVISGTSSWSAATHQLQNLLGCHGLFMRRKEVLSFLHQGQGIRQLQEISPNVLRQNGGVAHWRSCRRSASASSVRGPGSSR